MLTAGLMVMLLQAATPTQPTTAVPATNAQADAANKVICKRIPKTGSIITKEKVCHTRAEWQMQTENARSMATQIQDASNR